MQEFDRAMQHLEEKYGVSLLELKTAGLWC